MMSLQSGRVALAIAFSLEVATAHAAILTANQSTLSAALRAARPGDEIRVSGEITGPIAANFASPGVTLTAAPGASLGPDPRSKWFSIQGSGLTFRGFAVTSGGGASIGVSGNSSRIAFDRLNFVGLGALETGGGSGFMARDSTDISVTNSRFRTATAGMSFNNVRGITVKGNDFRDLWSDAIHIDTLGDVTVEGNTITDFRGPPLHLDAIQFSCNKATAPVSNLTIRNNRYTRGSGSPAQFIFMSDCRQGYTSFRITRNAAWGSAWHGITIVKPSDGVIEGNYLQGSKTPWNGQVLVPWIKPVDPGPGLVIRKDNRLPAPSADDAGLRALSPPVTDSAETIAEDLRAELAAAEKAAAHARAAAEAAESRRAALAAKVAATPKP